LRLVQPRGARPVSVLPSTTEAWKSQYLSPSVAILCLTFLQTSWGLVASLKGHRVIERRGARPVTVLPSTTEAWKSQYLSPSVAILCLSFLQTSWGFVSSLKGQGPANCGAARGLFRSLSGKAVTFAGRNRKVAATLSPDRDDAALGLSRALTCRVAGGSVPTAPAGLFRNVAVPSGPSVLPGTASNLALPMEPCL
jgi:hypothetical protein